MINWTEHTVVAPPRTTFSAHRPIAFSRTAPKRTTEDLPIISKRITEHPDFGRRVALEVHDLMMKEGVKDNPFRQLVLTKRAIHTVAKGIRVEDTERLETGSENQIGWILGFIRAAENVNLGRMHTCAKACPCIAEYVHPEDPEARSKPGIWSLKELAVRP